MKGQVYYSALSFRFAMTYFMNAVAGLSGLMQREGIQDGK